MNPRVYGLDLSLVSTGVASNAGWADVIKPPPRLRGHDRMAHLKAAILGHIKGADLVVVEGPSYGNQGAQRQAGHHERAGLWWLVTHALWAADVPTAVASPASVKKYACGSGNAAKDAVLVAVTRRFAWFDGNNDAGDAVILAALGAERMGVPMVQMPANHRVALDGVQWPEFGLPTQMVLGGVA